MNGFTKGELGQRAEELWSDLLKKNGKVFIRTADLTNNNRTTSALLAVPS